MLKKFKFELNGLACPNCARKIEDNLKKHEEMKNVDYKTGLTTSFRPNEAFAGEISSTFSTEKHSVLEKAMKLGTQFYNDFKWYIQMTDVGEEQFIQLFIQSAVVVQRLGQLYADRCFDNN